MSFPIADISNITSLVTHHGGVPRETFRSVCLGVTCVSGGMPALTREFDYGNVRPSNVCERCFCLGRLCFNFGPQGVFEQPHPCDQCRLDRASGCSSQEYHTKPPTMLNKTNRQILQRSRLGETPVEIPTWYIWHVLELRSFGLVMDDVLSLDDLGYETVSVPLAIQPTTTATTTATTNASGSVPGQSSLRNRRQSARIASRGPRVDYATADGMDELDDFADEESGYDSPDSRILSDHSSDQEGTIASHYQRLNPEEVARNPRPPSPLASPPRRGSRDLSVSSGTHTVAWSSIANVAMRRGYELPMPSRRVDAGIQVSPPSELHTPGAVHPLSTVAEPAPETAATSVLLVLPAPTGRGYTLRRDGNGRDFAIVPL